MRFSCSVQKGLIKHLFVNLTIKFYAVAKLCQIFFGMFHFEPPAYVDSAFYPSWDNKMSITFWAEEY